MLHMPLNDMLYEDQRQSYLRELGNAVIEHKSTMRAWVTSRGGLADSADDEQHYADRCSSNLVGRLQHLDEDRNFTSLQSDVAVAPLTGTCDAFAGLTVFLEDVSEITVKEFALFPASSKAQGKKVRQTSQVDPKGTVASTSNPGKPAQPNNKDKPYNVFTGAFPRPSATPPREVRPVSSRDIKGVSLDLPLLVAEYKKQAGESHATKATNQIRMYLTASVKFLQAVGITGFIVYGMVTDGPRVIFPAAVMTEQGVNVLFLILISNYLISYARPLTCLTDSLR